MDQRTMPSQQGHAVLDPAGSASPRPAARMTMRWRSTWSARAGHRDRLPVTCRATLQSRDTSLERLEAGLAGESLAPRG
jgi:hypothetical protein